MRKTIIALTLCAVATSAAAQVSRITTTRSGGVSDGVFSIGPRISNYSTDIEAGPAPLETGRQSGFGVVGDYRAGNFVLDFSFDHDPENGIGVSELIIDTGNYERDRGEFTVGLAVAPMLDLQAGVRMDQIRIGGGSFFGNSLFSDLDIEHQAITAGVRLHGGDREPVGWYLLGRGYLGSSDFDVVDAVNVNDDTTGFRAEAGVSIRMGQTTWFVVPGIEYESLQTDQYNLELNSNRFFLNFVYRSGL